MCYLLLQKELFKCYEVKHSRWESFLDCLDGPNITTVRGILIMKEWVQIGNLQRDVAVLALKMEGGGT